MSKDVQHETLWYLEHLERIGEPPSVTIVELPLDRPTIVDHDGDTKKEWTLQNS